MEKFFNIKCRYSGLQPQVLKFINELTVYLLYDDVVYNVSSVPLL
jgi:formyltetrahydrofolate synthetase